MSDLRVDWRDGVVAYPRATVSAYRRTGLWGRATIPQELREIVRRHPDLPAVCALDGRLTYAELDERTDRVAAGLHELGLRPGDRIVFQLANGLGAVLAWYGSLKAGLIPVCALVAHRRHEIEAIAAVSRARAHVVQADLPRFDLVAFACELGGEAAGPRAVLTVGAREPVAGTTRIEDLGAELDLGASRGLVDAVQSAIDPDEVAVFQLSGGTTSVPKIIPRLHAEYWYNATAYARFWGWGPDTRPAHLMPLIHNAGITCALHAAHAVGAAAVLGVPDAEALWPLLEQEHPTDVILNQPLVSRVLGHERLRTAVFADLRRLVYSGSKLPASVAAEIESGSAARIVQLFGMGEGLFMVTPEDASAQMRHHTVGVPLSPLDEVRVLDPAGEDELALGVEGELCCRGPYTIRGYYASPERNREAFTSDGFYRTGDLAVAREIDGVICYAIEGRLKDVINRGGEKVNAEEIELLIAEHPAVAAVAVVAMPDPGLGERACVYVVARPQWPPIALAELTAYLSERGVAKYKWPERIEVVDALPLTKVGKVDKRALREDVAARVRAEAR